MLEENAHPYRVFGCEGCDLAYVDPPLPRAALRRRYGAEYYAAWVTAQPSRRERMWAERLKIVERLVPTGRLLDVGCGDGSFLSLARRRGWEVAGTEISPWAAEHAGRRLGQPVFRGELRDAGYPPEHFDAVTLWHVLEHVTAPLPLLEEVRRILKTGGLLFVAVPNRDDRVMQAVYRLMKRRRPHLFSPRDRELHLFHFSVPSLTRMLDSAGFTVAHVGPDRGIVERSKRLVNTAAIVLSRLFHRPWYNAILTISRGA
ncbi:MAG: class I SAM-dependent methyltransferase [Desulfobacterales bacterium]